MERFLRVCIGSAVGGGARYLVSGWALKALGPAFPYGAGGAPVVATPCRQTSRRSDRRFPTAPSP